MFMKKKKKGEVSNKTINGNVIQSALSKYKLLPRKKIVAWKAYLTIVFLAGFVTALSLSYYYNLEVDEMFWKLSQFFMNNFKSVKKLYSLG